MALRWTLCHKKVVLGAIGAILIVSLVMMASFGGGKEDTSGAGTGASVAGMAAAAKEAVAALTALGYTNMEASKAVKKVEITENMSVEDILKASLKYLSFL